MSAICVADSTQIPRQKERLELVWLMNLAHRLLGKLINRLIFSRRRTRSQLCNKSGHLRYRMKKSGRLSDISQEEIIRIGMVLNMQQ